MTVLEVIAAVWLVGALTFVGLVVRATCRPPTPEEIYYGEVDRELEERGL